MTTKRRVLLFDIETTPAKVWTWGMYQQDVIKVIEQPFMLCFAYQWLGEKTKVVALPDFPLYKKEKNNDRELIKTLRDLLDEAEIVIGQNSDEFDIRWFNTRCISHHIAPPSPFKTYDTLKMSREKFRWMSNKLDFVADQLGHGHKKETGGFNLWEKCINGDRMAWEKMKRYCKHDVDLTAEVFTDYQPWMNQKVVWDNRKECPECKSHNTQRRGTLANKTGSYRRYQCMDCAHWFLQEKIIQRLCQK